MASERTEQANAATARELLTPLRAEDVFTQPDPTPLEAGMDNIPEAPTDEEAFFSFLAAREAAIAAAAGAFALDNTPSDRLRIIAQTGKGDGIVPLAARVVLYQRKEDWR